MSPLRFLCHLGIHWARYESQMLPEDYRVLPGWRSLVQWVECERCGKVLVEYGGSPLLARVWRAEVRARESWKRVLAEDLYTEPKP